MCGDGGIEQELSKVEKEAKVREKRSALSLVVIAIFSSEYFRKRIFPKCIVPRESFGNFAKMSGRRKN